MSRSLLLIYLFFIATLGAAAQNDLNCPHPDTSMALSYYKQAKAIMKATPQKMDSAFVYMNKAKMIFKKIKCWGQVVKMSYNLTVMYMRQKDVKRMTDEMYYAEQTAYLHLADTSLWYGKILSFMGQYHMRKMSLDSAEMYLLQARYLFKKNKEWKDFVSSCRILAQVSYYQQDYTSMENYIDEAFDATKDYLNRDKKLLKSILQLYGVLYYRTGDYETALDKTQEGLEIALRSMDTRSDTSQVASYYNNIGLFYIEIGDIGKAEDYCKSALSLSLQLKEWYKASTIYLNLAEFFVKQEQNRKAYEYFRKALVPLKKVNKNDVPQSDLDRTSVQINIGLARSGYQIAKKKVALKALDENLLIHAREPYKLEMTYLNYGQIFLKEEKLVPAKQYLDKALEKAQKLYFNDKHPDLADIYYEFAQYYFIKKEYNTALAYIDKSTSALTLSFEHLDKDISVVSDKNVLIKILKTKSKILVQQNKIKEAFENSLNAVTLTAGLRNSFKSEGSRLFIQKKVIPIYEQAIVLAIQLYQKHGEQSYLSKAFDLFEKTKSMLLLDALRAEDARAFGGVPDELLREEKRLERKLAKKQKEIFEAKHSNPKKNDALQQEILRLKRATQNLQDTLEKNYERYYILKYEDKTATLKDVQKNLERDVLLLEFFTGEEGIYWFGITATEAKIFQMPKDGILEKQLKALRLGLTSNRWLTKDDKLAEIHKLLTQNGYHIYKKLLKDCIKNNTKKLVVIPDGLLNYIPFEVLMTEKVKEGNSLSFKSLPYLVRKYAVNYHYSASLMLFERSKNRSNGRVLGMAPTFKYNDELKSTDLRQHNIRSSVDELPGAKSEVEALSQYFKGDFLYNEDANEAAFKNLMADKKYGVVHLAMHGWVDEKKPEYSNLVFSHVDNKEDNLLFAYELNFLKLDADLVVLSACETGYGKYERGEGVVSIGRGFMYAGVPSLLMTLWPINDQASVMLITEFYHELAKGKSKDIALRQAKLNYLKKANDLTAHPFFWASYISLGDEASIKIKRQKNSWNWILITSLVLAVGGGAFLFFYIKQKRKHALKS